MPSSVARPGRPVVVGEVLYDVFPGGRRILGGAPFNVAWNLRGLGLDPLFLSAVGNDEGGREIRARMQAWGLDDAWLQTADGYPTGEVRVTLDRGEPTYEILADRAYDQVRTPPDATGRNDAALLYHGSLAWRSETTRQAIREVRSALGVPVFVDVNVRQGFREEWLPELLAGASHVKLNREELALVSRIDVATDSGISRGVEILRERFGCENVWLTCGEEGAYAFLAGPGGSRQALRAEAPRSIEVVDTVGAGDAFAAVAVAGILSGADPSATLERAVQFAARVCGLRGAVTEDRDFYVAAANVAAPATSGG